MKTITNNYGDGISVVDAKGRHCEYATKEMLLEYFKEQFKLNGFKKSKQTWYKDDGQIIYMFNVQNSQYGNDSFYFNIGLIFSDNGLKLSKQYWNCWARMSYGKNMKNTFKKIMKWFKKYNTRKKIEIASKRPRKCLTDPHWRLGDIDLNK